MSFQVNKEKTLFYVVINAQAKAVLAQAYDLGGFPQTLDALLCDNLVRRVPGEEDNFAYSFIIPYNRQELPDGWMTIYVMAEWLFEAISVAQQFWWQSDPYSLKREIKISGSYAKIKEKKDPGTYSSIEKERDGTDNE
jgi:hypothetical protein